jgi:hypothetical protein
MHCVTSRKVAGSIPDGIIGIFQPHYAPAVDSASNRNRSRNITWEVKAADVWDWQPYHLHVPIILISGSFNLLQLAGPLQAFNGMALPLHYLKQCASLSFGPTASLKIYLAFTD